MLRAFPDLFNTLPGVLHMKSTGLFKTDNFRIMRFFAGHTSKNSFALTYDDI